MIQTMIQDLGIQTMVGETWTDNIEGKLVMTVSDPTGKGCKNCAFSVMGGGCPGLAYDRHPCCASDRKDGKSVYFSLIAYVPEKKYIFRKSLLAFHTAFA